MSKSTFDFSTQSEQEPHIDLVAEARRALSEAQGIYEQTHAATFGDPDTTEPGDRLRELNNSEYPVENDLILSLLTAALQLAKAERKVARAEMSAAHDRTQRFQFSRDLLSDDEPLNAARERAYGLETEQWITMLERAMQEAQSLNSQGHRKGRGHFKRVMEHFIAQARARIPEIEQRVRRSGRRGIPVWDTIVDGHVAWQSGRTSNPLTRTIQRMDGLPSYWARKKALSNSYYMRYYLLTRAEQVRTHVEQMLTNASPSPNQQPRRGSGPGGAVQ